MIQHYVDKLIDNLQEPEKEPIHIDLVLDGGIFNGSYLVGALYFLKEMEKRKYINIDRISGCSVGSIVGLLYFMDGLDIMPKLYEIIHKNFKQSYDLKMVKELKKILEDYIPTDICDKVNNRFYITYNNIKKCNKPVKSCYKNVDELISTIIRSCYIPLLIDGNILYENKYIDGFTPYIFDKELNKKILYLDLFGYDKVGNLLNVKNEKTNYHRILSGLLDIHSFFIKQSSTQMCSYVNDWNIINKSFNYCKILIERWCILIIYIMYNLKTNIPEEFKDTIICKIIMKISYDIFIILLEKYCF
jgi:hypothetical protein